MALQLRRAAAALALLLPAAAVGDIYKWTDEHGGTVYSNSLPENPRQAGTVERVARERVAPPVERALQDRIEELERRLRTQAHAPQPAPPAPVDYYYPPPPPSPPPSHISDSAPAFHPGYVYPLRPAYTYFYYRPRPASIRPATQVVRRGPARGGFVHRGRR